jgi:hypothetical protein
MSGSHATATRTCPSNSRTDHGTHRVGSAHSCSDSPATAPDNAEASRRNASSALTPITLPMGTFAGPA